jgi:hypothetical protein
MLGVNGSMGQLVRIAFTLRGILFCMKIEASRHLVFTLKVHKDVRFVSVFNKSHHKVILDF